MCSIYYGLFDCVFRCSVWVVQHLPDNIGNLIKTTAQSKGGAHGEVDHEDTGEKGYNYRSERFFNRLRRLPDISKVFSSRFHGDPFSATISVQGAVSVGGAYNIEFENGASEFPGDYLYRSGSLKWDVESGMWGILRVLKKGVKYCCSCVCRSIVNRWEKKWYDKYR